jgi:hypothetical protein
VKTIALSDSYSAFYAHLGNGLRWHENAPLEPAAGGGSCAPGRACTSRSAKRIDIVARAIQQRPNGLCVLTLGLCWTDCMASTSRYRGSRVTAESLLTQGAALALPMRPTRMVAGGQVG